MDADRHLLTTLVLARGTVDRAAARRADDGWLEARRSEPQAWVMDVHDGSARLVDGEPALAFRAAVDVDLSTPLTFLGEAEDGAAFFARHLAVRDGAEAGDERPDAGTWVDLRGAGAQLSDRDAGLMVAAVALDGWHRSHPRCPLCGASTQVSAAGWGRRCPVDDSEHFPRTDPAVIVLVRDRDDRALLGRQARWSPGWFSTLAGFVEAGESAEAALRREVFEEAGVVIGAGDDDIWYLGSQPWPFPRSLMLGYHAWVDDPRIDVDGEEIAEARWFSRDELAQACASGEVRLPPSISIARRLVERWYGSELPGDWSRDLRG
jgi:NAD+ diphosphatase